METYTRKIDQLESEKLEIEKNHSETVQNLKAELGNIVKYYPFPKTFCHKKSFTKF